MFKIVKMFFSNGTNIFILSLVGIIIGISIANLSEKRKNVKLQKQVVDVKEEIADVKKDILDKKIKEANETIEVAQTIEDLNKVDLNITDQYEIDIDKLIGDINIDDYKPNKEENTTKVYKELEKTYEKLFK